MLFYNIPQQKEIPLSLNLTEVRFYFFPASSNETQWNVDYANLYYTSDQLSKYKVYYLEPIVPTRMEKSKLPSIRKIWYMTHVDSNTTPSTKCLGLSLIRHYSSSLIVLPPWFTRHSYQSLPFPYFTRRSITELRKILGEVWNCYFCAASERSSGGG